VTNGQLQGKKLTRSHENNRVICSPESHERNLYQTADRAVEGITPMIKDLAQGRRCSGASCLLPIYIVKRRIQPHAQSPHDANPPRHRALQVLCIGNDDGECKAIKGETEQCNQIWSVALQMSQIREKRLTQTTRETGELPSSNRELERSEQEETCLAL
jgi:hypothetical protein